MHDDLMGAIMMLDVLSGEMYKQVEPETLPIAIADLAVESRSLADYLTRKYGHASDEQANKAITHIMEGNLK